MNTFDATAEVFWTAFNGLSKKGKSAFIHRLLEDEELLEDMIDIRIAQQRSGESSVPLDTFLKQRGL